MNIKGILSFLVCMTVTAVIGRYYSLQSFSQRGNLRGPAAVDPKSLATDSEPFLDSSAKKRIVGGTKVWKENGAIAISVGHFLTKSMQGETAQLCDLYSDVEVTFSAEGLAVSGNKPSMIIESPCIVSESMDHTRPVWVPINELKNNRETDAEFRFTSPSNVTIRLKDIPNEWPNFWVLTNIKLDSKSRSQSLLIDGATIYKMSGVPVSFNLD